MVFCKARYINFRSWPFNFSRDLAEKRYHLFPFVWVRFSEVPLTDFKTPAKIASWLTRDPAFYLRLLFRTFLAKMWNRLVTTFRKVWILFCLNLSSWSSGESTMKLVKVCCNLMIKIYDSATSLNFTNFCIVGKRVKLYFFSYIFDSVQHLTVFGAILLILCSDIVMAPCP